MKRNGILRVAIVALILVACVNRALALVEDPDSEHHDHEHHNEEEEADHHDHEDHGGEHTHLQDAGEDEDTIANVVPSSSEDDEKDHDDHNHEHHDHHHTTPAARQFGEDCSSNADDEKCDEEKGLTCSDGKCACSQDPAHLEYSEEDKCVEKVKEEAKDLPEVPEVVTEMSMLPKAVEVIVNLEEESEEEEAKESSEHVAKCSEKCSEKMGKLSKCDEERGECICHDTEQGSRPTVEVSGKCWLVRKINDNCTSHDECSKTIKGKAWCHMDFEKVERYCQCEAFYYFDESLEECLPLAVDGVFSPCKTDKQCTGFGVDGQGLGPRSLCSSETNKCICQLGLDGEKGFLQDNYCYSKLRLGDYCHKDRECQLNLPHLDVVCSEETKTCSCRSKDENGDCPLKVIVPEVMKDEAFDGRSLGEGEQEEGEMRDGTVDSMKSATGGLNGSNFVYAMIIGGVVVCAVVIALVVVLRRRHRYSVVRTRDTTADIADASQP